ncbi:MAG: biosynthetic-type acetolactate synthase large subunit [Oscillospiraceae bacterium]|nr:biosynthetic-type acetolactate synthase large subunit [Oscillospiraceae bacterium]
MMLNGSEILLETLLEQGVDTVFGYPGGAVLNIYDALYNYSDRINHILASHEQHACHAADGYARTTGKTGVVIATSGPGASNLVTGLATANMDSIPIVAITGNVTTSLLGLDSFQEINITGVTKPITKKNWQVTDVTKLADVVREAFFVANEGRKGPVLIDITKNVTADLCEFEREPVRDIPTVTEKDSTLLEKAAELIAASERPLIITGGGTALSCAEKELSRLAELTDAPVCSTLMGINTFDNTDPAFLGMLGMHGTKAASQALVNADLIIALGTRFSDRVTCSAKSFEKNIENARIIHIDVDTKEFDKNVKADLHIHSDVRAALTAINDALSPVQRREWKERCIKLCSEYPLYQTSEDKEAVLPQYVLETLAELTNREAIITTEVGQHQMWTAQFFPFKVPHSFATSGGLGTMGYGFGAAIGAKAGNPDRTVVNIAGDGSFYMNIGELSTLSKYRMPVIELVFNNSVLGMVRQWQRLFYDKHFSQTTLEKPTDFEALAKAFGVAYVCITKKSEVREKLEYALNCGEPVLINCVIDKDVNVLPMVPAGKSVAAPLMELNIDD